MIRQGVRACLFASDQVLIGLFAFLTLFLAARSASGDQVGLFAALWALTTVQTVMAGLGLAPLIYARTARRPRQRQRLAGRGAVASGVASGVLYGATLAILLAALGPEAGWLYSGLGLRLVLSLAEQQRAADQARGVPERHVVPRLATITGMALAMGAVCLWQGDLVWLAWLAGLEALFFTGWLVWQNKLGGDARVHQIMGRPRHIRKALTLAAPLMIQGLAIMAYMRFDMLYVAARFGPSETALYAAGARIAETGNALVLVSALMVAPGLIRRGPVGTDAPLRFSALSFATPFLVGVGFAVAMALAAPTLLTLMFGSAYNQAAAILTVYALSVPFVGVGSLASRLHVARSNMARPMHAALFGAALNIAATLVLGAHLGPIGAAYATVLSFAGVTGSLMLGLRDARPGTPQRATTDANGGTASNPAAQARRSRNPASV